MLVLTSRWSKQFFGLLRLMRPLPVMAWGGGAVMLGTALSVAEQQVLFSWSDLVLPILGVLLLQGIAAHAFNDWEDWQSGTDQTSPGILSGGSKALTLNLLTCSQVLGLGKISIFAVLLLTIYLFLNYDPLILIFPAAGIWAALAYTCPPLRLAYKPLLGEWLAAWPAMVACTLGTNFLLAGNISNLAWWVGCLHATLSIAWLMQHHLPDITADLAALPAKYTTVAYIQQRWGWRYTVLPAACYFIIAIIAAIFAVSFHPGFLFSIVAGILGLRLALATNPQDIQDITQKQIEMMLVSMLHFCLLSLSLWMFPSLN